MPLSSISYRYWLDSYRKSPASVLSILNDHHYCSLSLDYYDAIDSDM